MSSGKCHYFLTSGCQLSRLGSFTISHQPVAGGANTFLAPQASFQVSRRQDAPMRSIDVLWFHHVQTSPFSITVCELQAPQHATVTNFVSTSDFMRFHGSSARAPHNATNAHKQAHTRAQLAELAKIPPKIIPIRWNGAENDLPTCRLQHCISSTPTKLDAASRRGLPCHVGCGS